MKLFFSILFIFYAGEKSWGNDSLDKLESYTELRRYMVQSGIRPDAFVSGLSKKEMANPVFENDPEWKARLLAESEIHRILKHFISVDDVEGVKLSLRALASDGDVNIRLDFSGVEIGEEWITPLKEAIRMGDVEIIERLIERGAQLSVVDRGQNTALHVAAFYGQSHLIDTFLRLGEDVDARNSNGETPLLRLTRARYVTEMSTFFFHSALVAPGITTERVVETATLLLNRGADVSAMDKSALTPLVNVGLGSVLGDLFIENGASEEEIERWDKRRMEARKRTIEMIKEWKMQAKIRGCYDG